jgi:hypothetical protein
MTLAALANLMMARRFLSRHGGIASTMRGQGALWAESKLLLADS